MELSKDLRQSIFLAHVVTTTIWLIVVVFIVAIERSALVGLIGLIFGLIMLTMTQQCDSGEDDDTLFMAGIPVMGVIAGTTFINLKDQYKGDVRVMWWLLFIGFISIFLTVPHIYFGHDYLPLTHHLRLLFCNFSISVFALAATLFFLKIDLNSTKKGKDYKNECGHLSAEIQDKDVKTSENE
jgi:hypothetical protein